MKKLFSSLIFLFNLFLLVSLFPKSASALSSCESLGYSVSIPQVVTEGTDTPVFSVDGVDCNQQYIFKVNSICYSDPISPTNTSSSCQVKLDTTNSKKCFIEENDWFDSQVTNSIKLEYANSIGFINGDVCQLGSYSISKPSYSCDSIEIQHSDPSITNNSTGEPFTVIINNLKLEDNPVYTLPGQERQLAYGRPMPGRTIQIKVNKKGSLADAVIFDQKLTPLSGSSYQSAETFTLPQADSFSGDYQIRLEYGGVQQLNCQQTFTFDIQPETTKTISCLPNEAACKAASCSCKYYPDGTSACLDSARQPCTTTSTTSTGGVATEPKFCSGSTDDNPIIKTAIGCIPANVAELTDTILTRGISIGAGIAFLLMLYGAFTFITSAGNPEKTKLGGDILTSAIVGLLFIILSVFLLKVIGIDILQLEGFSSPQTQTPPAPLQQQILPGGVRIK